MYASAIAVAATATTHPFKLGVLLLGHALHLPLQPDQQLLHGVRAKGAAFKGRRAMGHQGWAGRRGGWSVGACVVAECMETVYTRRGGGGRGEGRRTAYACSGAL